MRRLRASRCVAGTMHTPSSRRSNSLQMPVVSAIYDTSPISQNRAAVHLATVGESLVCTAIGTSG